MDNGFLEFCASAYNTNKFCIVCLGTKDETKLVLAKPYTVYFSSWSKSNTMITGKKRLCIWCARKLQNNFTFIENAKRAEAFLSSIAGVKSDKLGTLTNAKFEYTYLKSQRDKSKLKLRHNVCSEYPNESSTWKDDILVKVEKFDIDTEIYASISFDSCPSVASSDASFPDDSKKLEASCIGELDLYFENEDSANGNINEERTNCSNKLKSVKKIMHRKQRRVKMDPLESMDFDDISLGKLKRLTQENSSDIIMPEEENSTFDSRVETEKKSVDSSSVYKDDEDLKLNPDNLEDGKIKENGKDSSGRKKKKSKLVKRLAAKIPNMPDYVESLIITRDELDLEMEELAKEKRYEDAVYKCTSCIKGFVHEDAYSTHMVRHREDYGPHQCEVCLQYMTNLDTHYRNHFLRFKCKECDYTRMAVNSVVSHYQSRHVENNSQLYCVVCNKRFNNLSSRRKHERQAHLFPKIKVACTVCGNLYAKDYLKTHMLTHEDPSQLLKRFECNICHNRFPSNYVLKKHEASHIKGVNGFFCELCNKVFKTKMTYATHHARKHVSKDTYKFECDVCRKRYLMKSDLRRHIQWVHLGELDECPHCFKRYTNLSGHIRQVHGGAKPPRTAMCYVCGKSFPPGSPFRNHMAVHTGERPYKCDTCGSSFGQRSTLNTHIKLVHLKVKRDAQPTRINPPNRAVITMCHYG